AIARALAMKRKILRVDEPTSALDPAMVQEVLDVMEELPAGGMTTVVVTHEKEFARKARDRLLFMSDGEIVEDATTHQLYTDSQTSRAQDFLSKILTE